jgi:pentatricopeptide repeat protein
MRVAAALGDWQAALTLLQPPVVPNTAPSPPALLDVGVMVTVCAQCDELSRALEALDAIIAHHQSITPTIREQVDVTVLDSLAKSELWTAALALFARRHTSGVSTTELFNAAIGACERSDQWEQALNLFGMMENQGLTRAPNAVTYALLLAALERCNKAEEAHKLSERMPKTERDRVLESYSNLINTWGKRHESRTALRF